MCRFNKCCVASVFTVAIVFIIAGSLLIGLREKLVDVIIRMEFPVKPDSETYQLWKDPPVPMYLSFYLFNCTNWEDVQNKGSSPVLKEMGPYTYKEVHHLENIKWNDNGTVSFNMKRSWYFSPDRSNGSESDLVTALNVPFVATMERLRNQTSIVKWVVNKLLHGIKETLFVTKPVNEWVFDGYSDNLLDKIKEFEKIINKSLMPFDRFGWFYQRNNTLWADGNFTMYTGKHDISRLGVLERWNFEHTTHYYPAPCGVINGSAGQLFPPRPDKTSVSIFITDMCRDITFNFVSIKSNPNFSSGVYHYEADASMIANATDNPANQCFNNYPRPSGVFDVSACKMNAPVFISYPHFYLADEYYRRQVTGLHPNGSIHTPYIDLEPVTGTATKVAARFQINLQLTPMKGISLLKNVSTVLIPMMWFEEDVTTTPELTSMVLKLVRAPHTVVIAGSIVLTIGSLSLLVLIVNAIRQKMPLREEKQPLIRKNPGESYRATERHDSNNSYQNTAHPLHSDNLLTES